MTNLRKMAGQLSAVSCVLLLAASVAGGQSLFSSGIVVPLAGDITSALPILVVADVGSVNGPVDGCADLITADYAYSGAVTIAYGIKSVSSSNCTGTFSTAYGACNGPCLNGIPVALVLANFDGVNDLVVADTSDNVWLFHGDPTPTYSFDPPGPPVAVGHSGVTAIAAADVDHDGNMDLVVLYNEFGIGGVTVLKGDGKGGFSPAPRFCVAGANKGQQCIADKDCGAGFAAGSCQDGTTNFVPLGSGLSALTVADFNGDGALDLAVTNAHSVTILRGNGSGGFSVTQTILEDPTVSDFLGLAAGDLNGDGQRDLVVVNHGYDNVAVFNGVADGSFQAPRFFSSGTATSQPNSITLFDANHDGKLDVAVSNYFSSDVSVLLGDGKGNLAAPRAFVTDQEPRIVVASDVNSDGIPDLIALNNNTQGNNPNAVVLLGQGDGSFRGVENVISGANPNAVVAGDTDNHGECDLIVAHSTGVVEVHRAVPGAGFAAPVELQSHGDAVAVGVGDFNGDGRLDIAAVNSQTSDVSVFLGQRSGFSSTPTANIPIGTSGSAVAVGDWNGDGRADLAVTTSSGVTILLAAPDGSFAPLTPGITVGANPVAIDVGDFNNKDGKLDLAVADSTGTVSILRGNGDGTFQAATPLSTSLPSVVALAVGDFDDDGYDDIAVAQAGTSPKVQVLYGSAQGTFTLGPTPLTSVGIPSSIAARDFTGDMVPDLVVLDQQNNVVVGFKSNGHSRTFTSAGSFTVGRLPLSVAVGDFDGDGRYDAAAADTFDAGTVSVLTNIQTASVLRGDSNGDQKVSAADIISVIKKLRGTGSIRVEQVAKSTYAVGPGADANGDGLVNPQDLFAIAHRLFPRL